MARPGYSYVSSAWMTPTRPPTPMPHSVTVQADEYRDIQRWVCSKEAKGKYRFDEGFANKRVYYFSNPDTALEFKMRFG
jgi:hypothetical protein